MLHVDRQGGTWRLLGSVIYLHRQVRWTYIITCLLNCDLTTFLCICCQVILITDYTRCYVRVKNNQIQYNKYRI